MYSDDNETEKELALLGFSPKMAPTIFDKLNRSNFSILGLRTARLSKSAQLKIFHKCITGYCYLHFISFQCFEGIYIYDQKLHSQDNFSLKLVIN